MDALAANEAESVTVGWIGLGRMGVELASRLLDAGYPLRVWNRTRSKADPLAARGARVVDTPAELAGCDVVVTLVADSDGVRECDGR